MPIFKKYRLYYRVYPAAQLVGIKLTHISGQETEYGICTRQATPSIEGKTGEKF
jgi:hypothetical protein